MAQGPFVIQPRLTALAMTYVNEAFIADSILPRLPVDSSQFKYSKYTLADGFTIVDTRIGRKSAPNEIDWTALETPDFTVNYGLQDRIPIEDLNNAAAAMSIQGVMPIDPEARSTQLLTDLVALDREKRVADLITTLTTYQASQRTTLSGTSQWSDYANSNPIDAILTALDACLVRPNILQMGQAAWTKFRQHPKVAAAIFPGGGNATSGGGGTTVAAQQVADLLEIEEVIIGKGWYNAAKPGQAPTMTRLWGKHAALLYRNPQIIDPLKSVTFGFTAQFGEKVVGTIVGDPNIGLEGGNTVRVGERVKEVICANDAGYFFQNCVA
jgi:hypothetical protein